MTTDAKPMAIALLSDSGDVKNIYDGAHGDGNKCRPDFHREASNVKSPSLSIL